MWSNFLTSRTVTTPPCDLMELLKAPIPVLRHVPARLQALASQMQAAALHAYLDHPSEDSLFPVLAFPKLVLRHVVGKGKF